MRETPDAVSAPDLSRLADQDRHAFDQACRATAIALAAGLGLAESGACLSINYSPNAIYEPKNCIRPTLKAALQHHIPPDRLILEVTEQEHVRDPAHLATIIKEYRRQGLRPAIDDFGAGYAGLRLLADFQPDFLKLDGTLTRAVETDHVRRAIVRGLIGVCRELGITLIAEGVERQGQVETLRAMGVALFQGFFFAAPAFERLPAVAF